MNFLSKLFFTFSLLFLIVILVLTAVFFPTEENSSLHKIVEIPGGSSAHQIINILEEEGIVRKNNYILGAVLKFARLEEKLKYGEYDLSPAMNMAQILEKLVKGEVVLYKITIPEGYNSEQIAELLDKKGIVEKESFLKLVKNNEKSWEGYLFPDTYEVPKGYGGEKMLKLLLSNFNQQVVDKLAPKIEESQFSLPEIIILASLIEKEAKYEEEKSKVSSVFYNRLKKGMKLQSCATIQYILGTPKERLEEADLKIDSPYNTYLYAGLPPGPICNPGLESIIAALEPAESNWLYFVLGEDGRHIFSETYEEHLKNQNQNQR